MDIKGKRNPGTGSSKSRTLRQGNSWSIPRTGLKCDTDVGKQDQEVEFKVKLVTPKSVYSPLQGHILLVLVIVIAHLLCVIYPLTQF